MNCFVVTNSENGWDCVIGVFMGDVTYEQLLARFPREQRYYIDQRTVDTCLSDYE